MTGFCRSLSFVIMLLALLDVAVSPVEAFPGGTIVRKLASRFGDDVFRGVKSGGDDVGSKVGRFAIKNGDDLFRQVSKYGSAEVMVHLGKRGRILVRSAEKNKFSAGRMRELIDFLGEKGEQGALFLERHWKLVLGGAGVYSLWENENYQRSHGNGDDGMVSSIVRGIRRVVDGVSWSIVALAGFFVSLLGIRWAVPTYKRIMPMIRESKNDGPGRSDKVS